MGGMTKIEVDRGEGKLGAKRQKPCGRCLLKLRPLQGVGKAGAGSNRGHEGPARPPAPSLKMPCPAIPSFLRKRGISRKLQDYGKDPAGTFIEWVYSS